MIEILLILGVAAFVLVRAARRDRGSAPELGPVGWVDGTRWSVVRPLARAEVRRLLLHPAFIVGVLITPLFLWLATSVDSAGKEWLEASGGMALGLAPFGWFTIAATQLLTTRPARTGADTLLASLPAPQPTRTAALLSTIPSAVMVAALFAAANVALLSNQDRIGSPDLGEIAAGVLLAGGAVAVGVAVGRYLPHPLFAVGGAIAVILIQARFLDPTTWPWDTDEASPIRFLGFLANATSSRAELEFRPAGWHIVYLLGLTAVMAVVALARNGMPRVLGGALAVAVGVAALGGWMQTRPASDARVAKMVSFLQEPAKHQTCTVRTSGRFCVYRGGEHKIAQWETRASEVLALVPVKVSRLEVSERVPTVVGNSSCSPIPFTESLVPAVLRTIDRERVWAPDGAVHPGTDTMPCSSDSVHGLFFATQVASWAVGLPSSPRAGDKRCYADGQARAALALWLGAAATPEGGKRLPQIVRDETADHLRFEDWTDPPMFGVYFWGDDARVALAMLDRPARDVSAAIAPHWARLTAKSTPTSELVSVLGLNVATEPARVQTDCP